MTSDQYQKADYLPSIRALQQAVESGDDFAFHSALSELTALHESRLFQEVGRLTRQLHDAMNQLRIDSQVAGTVSDTVPDARSRLNEVIRLTHDSAHRTMDLAESSKPLLDALRSRSEDVLSRWERIQVDGTPEAGVQALAEETVRFVQEARDTSTHAGQHFEAIVMAQNYQDLSGQLITQVIDLLAEVESTLVGIIELSGRTDDGESEAARRQAGAGKEQADRLDNQDDVDDLLSSFGF